MCKIACVTPQTNIVWADRTLDFGRSMHVINRGNLSALTRRVPCGQSNLRLCCSPKSENLVALFDYCWVSRLQTGFTNERFPPPLNPTYEFLIVIYFLRLYFTYMEAPAMPKNVPTSPITYEKKFKNRVDSSTFTTINSGRTIPARTKIAPITNMRMGVKKLIRTTSRRSIDRVPAQLQAVP